jgi:hypothetical protein
MEVDVRSLKRVRDSGDNQGVALLPNSLSFRMVATITVADPAEIPDGYTGRVRVVGDNGLDSVLWLDRGQLDDPASDIPAVTRFRASGAVKQERHYRLGRLHDPEPGVPAVRGYFADGAIKYAEHFRYGWRHDSGDLPAIRKWRADGTLRTVRHYLDDLRVERDLTARRVQRRGGASPSRSVVDASPGSRTKQ